MKEDSWNLRVREKEESKMTPILWFCIWLVGDAVCLEKEEWKKRTVICGEDDGLISAHVECGCLSDIQWR